jgi:hypothetical protein
MDYHLNRAGQNLGVFPPEELRRRRAAGELNGTEMVWTQGMTAWQPLDSVLPPGTPPSIAPAASGGKKTASHKVLIVSLFFVGLFLAGVCVLGIVGFRMYVQPALKSLSPSAMNAASKPVSTNDSIVTAAEVLKTSGEFRMRQFVEGYQLRGERNRESDALALGLLTNWIAGNFNGTVDTNLPPLPDLSEQLANDPACTDPLVLTAAAANTTELRETIRRLERAVNGFETSKHLGYPKFYATVMLADKLILNRAARVPVLDSHALQYLQDAFSDGSIRPEDQADIADTLINDWGQDFFSRNPARVMAIVQARGDAFRWLALMLAGENEINEAWRARGDGYSDSVSPSGWTGFNEHLASARRSLTQAWKLKPNLPLAPCRMMRVSLGDGDIGEMRVWFDRTVSAQIDYPEAWSEMRWGLRPRWFGNTDAMLAFGITALNTRRFDTDVPRTFFDSVSDLESDLDLPAGRHIYGRKDIWPHLRELYEGYIAEPSLTPELRDSWRSSYAVIAYLAGKYDVARDQLIALNWQPNPTNLTGWTRDLSLMPLEVAARTGTLSQSVAEAESSRQDGDIAGALEIYGRLKAITNTDALTRSFIHERLASLGTEQRFQSGQWMPFLPSDTNFTGWQVNFGKCVLLPDGALEVTPEENGHMLYSRARVGTEFEVRGQFEVVGSNSEDFQAGLVMGIPQYETFNWYAFRLKRNDDDGNAACFSQQWTIRRQILASIPLNNRTNSFYFRFQDGCVSATVNGEEVFTNTPAPEDSYVTTNEFLLGLGAFNHSKSSAIRYRDVEVRRLSSQ